MTVKTRPPPGFYHRVITRHSDNKRCARYLRRFYHKRTNYCGGTRLRLRKRIKQAFRPYSNRPRNGIYRLRRACITLNLIRGRSIVCSHACVMEDADRAPVVFDRLELLCTCSDDFLVDDPQFRQCLKGCKW